MAARDRARAPGAAPATSGVGAARRSGGGSPPGQPLAAPRALAPAPARGCIGGAAAAAAPGRSAASARARWRFGSSFAARMKVSSASARACAHAGGVSWCARLAAIFQMAKVAARPGRWSEVSQAQGRSGGGMFGRITVAKEVRNLQPAADVETQVVAAALGARGASTPSANTVNTRMELCVDTASMLCGVIDTTLRQNSDGSACGRMDRERCARRCWVFVTVTVAVRRHQADGPSSSAAQRCGGTG